MIILDAETPRPDVISGDSQRSVAVPSQHAVELSKVSRADGGKAPRKQHLQLLGGGVFPENVRQPPPFASANNFTAGDDTSPNEIGNIIIIT